MKRHWRNFWAAWQEALQYYFAPRMDSYQLVRIKCRPEESERRLPRRRY